jgi:hypothetical protein
MALKMVEYYSQASDGVVLADMTEIAASLLRLNGTLEVTGWLIFGGTRFYRYLDRESGVVDRLHRDVLVDPPRHDAVTLTNETIDRRRVEGWSIDLTETGGAEAIRDALERDDSARPNDAGAKDQETPLGPPDEVGPGDVQPAAAYPPAGEAAETVEAAGRRWLTLRYETFVDELSVRTFRTTNKVAITIVDNVLMYSQQGPAASPDLKAFLLRRADLTYDEIAKACRKLQSAVRGRGDVLDGLGITKIIAAVTAVTFTVRALCELDPVGLKMPEVHRILVNLCLSALSLDDDSVAPQLGLKANRKWIAALIT